MIVPALLNLVESFEGQFEEDSVRPDINWDKIFAEAGWTEEICEKANSRLSIREDESDYVVHVLIDGKDIGCIETASCGGSTYRCVDVSEDDDVYFECTGLFPRVLTSLLFFLKDYLK